MNLPRVILSLAVSLLILAGPAGASAQMRAFEQSMGRLNKKLSTFDGAALNITTYAQLTTAAQFVNSYKANLGKAIKAWNGLIKTARNSERHKNLSARKAYFDALVKAFKEKAKVIKPPKKVAPKVVRKITLDEIYVGPDAGGDKPYLLDIHGRE